MDLPLDVLRLILAQLPFFSTARTALASRDMWVYIWGNIGSLGLQSTINQSEVSPAKPSAVSCVAFLQSNTALQNLKKLYVLNVACQRGFAALSRTFSTVFARNASTLQVLELDKSRTTYHEAVFPTLFYPIGSPPPLQNVLQTLKVQNYHVSLSTLQTLCEKLTNLRELDLRCECFVTGGRDKQPQPGQLPADFSPEMFGSLTSLVSLRLSFGSGIPIASRSIYTSLTKLKELIFWDSGSEEGMGALKTAGALAWIQERRSRCPKHLLSLQPIEPALLCSSAYLCDVLMKLREPMFAQSEANSSGILKRHYAVPILHYLISPKSQPTSYIDSWLQALSEALPSDAFRRLLNCVDETFGVTPIMLSILRMHSRFTEKLLSCGADPTIKCPAWFDRCALFAAASKSILQTSGTRLAQLWLKHAPKDREIRDVEGQTPLMMIRYRDEAAHAVTKFAHDFPQLGFDLNAKTFASHGGNTFLHILAEESGYPALQVASELVANGADLFATNTAGLTALHVAMQHRNRLFAQQLLRSSSNSGTLLALWDTSKLSPECPTMLHCLIQACPDATVISEISRIIKKEGSTALLKLPINPRGELVIPWALRQFASRLTEDKDKAIRELLYHLVAVSNKNWVLDALDDGFFDAPAYFYGALGGPSIYFEMLKMVPGAQPDAVDSQGRNVLHFVLDKIVKGSSASFLTILGGLHTYPQLVENRDGSNRTLLHCLISALPAIDDGPRPFFSHVEQQNLVLPFLQSLAKFAHELDAHGESPKSLYLAFVESHHFDIGEQALQNNSGGVSITLSPRQFVSMVHGHLMRILGLGGRSKESIKIAFKFVYFGLTEALIHSRFLSPEAIENGILDTPHPERENETLLTWIMDAQLGKASIKMLLDSDGARHVEACLKRPSTYQFLVQKGNISLLKILITRCGLDWQPGQLAALIGSVPKFPDISERRWKLLFNRIFAKTLLEAAPSVPPSLTVREQKECIRLAQSIKNSLLSRLILYHLEQITPTGRRV
eukprot:TRINITY_DN916_c1_g2_i1.p1 TRINITY_DN916_c1_g2~~TRINITY_DN916_c1_g2_i1.p1  ORF type:complete len:1012 (+),score=147.07 TRINITY_DN916_c1_g2_i1:52-3087(+)